MNNEIKQILDYLKNNSYTFDEVYIENYCKIITREENEKLLDYITNLQEENETLKELNVCVGCNNNPDYKARIDNAIEYIKSNEFIGKIRLSSENKQSINNLLDILQGSDKE